MISGSPSLFAKSDERRRIAFFCLNAFSLFVESSRAPVGGMETRAALFAKSLAKRRHWAIDFYVGNFGQPNKVVSQGVTLWKKQSLGLMLASSVRPRFSKRKWFPIINGEWSELHLIWQIPLYAFIYKPFQKWLNAIYWQRQKIDVACCFGVSDFSAEVIAELREVGIPVVLLIASDSDLSESYIQNASGYNRYGATLSGCHQAIVSANAVVVQSEQQRSLLYSRFNREGVVIRNPVALLPQDLALPPEREYVLWIGRADTFHKRPLLMLEAALRCPDIPFVMIMNPTLDEVCKEMQSRKPANLTIVDRVPHSDIFTHFRRAVLFASTSSSEFEGFPNTFLQAGVCGTPIVSFEVDPDHILERHQCGLVAHSDIETLVNQIRAVWADAALADRLSSAMMDYVVSHHSLSERLDELENVIRGLPMVSSGKA